MNSASLFEIRKYEFTPKLFNDLQNFHYAKDLWPIVYILSDGANMEAYVGETTDTYARISSHLKNDIKRKLTAIHLITSEKFNKSATLDIESNLIRYISGDGKYKLVNGNIGLANHNYYQKKEVYWNVFKSIWDGLRAEGISTHSIEYINNSDLFKYSPYKSLTPEQKNGVLLILRNLVGGDFKSIVIEGGAGTGKTILAVFLFKLIHSSAQDFNFQEFGEEECEVIELVTKIKARYIEPKMALVVPMSSFRNTLKKVFKNVKGLNSDMVVGPSDIAKDTFDIVLVDESHRLRRRVNLGTYFGAFDAACEKLDFNKNNCSELDWILKQSKNVILFYDENQSIKPSDARKEAFEKLKSAPSTKVKYLKSQFRVRGGNDYVNYVHQLLAGSLTENNKFNSREYEFVLFDSIEAMIQQIKLRNEENGLSRLIAGYSWEWISKKNDKLFDIKIDGVELKWNSVSDDWVNSENSVNEVGCIHTTQGYDLNYAGIIFGNEISYDPTRREIVILKENYFDKNGKQSITNPDELKDFIVNIYKTLMFRGIKGTYVYVCDDHLRQYFAEYITKYKSEKPTLFLRKDKVVPFLNAIPVYNLTAAAGHFSDPQEVNENIEDFEWVSLPKGYKYSNDLFACIVKGDSMNKVIPNGALCLFRKYSGGSRNGKIVLVQQSSIQDLDFGSGYTVKEYSSKKDITGEHWSHERITLKPRSYNSKFDNIELADDDSSSLKVIGIFERVLS